MTINWDAFTPVQGLAGGVLIGCAAVAFILLNGRIAGVSGVVGGLLTPRSGDIAWRAAFIAGLVAAPLIWASTNAELPEIVVSASYPLVILGGLIVGISTRYGGGCTSGHGVCGVSRLSPRSVVATLCFMATGFATVYVVRHLLGLG